MTDICLFTKTWRAGVAWQVQKIAQAVAEGGAQVTFIAPLAEPAWREPKHPNLHRILTPRELVGDQSRLTRAAASLQRVAAGFAAVLGQRPKCRTFFITIPDPLVFSLPLFVLLRLSGARILFMVHDAVPHAWRLGPSFKWLERGAHALSYRLATTLIVLTPPLRIPLVRDFGIPEEKVVVIPHGPFTIDPVPPIPGEGRLFLFGTFRSNKCVLEVIQGIIEARRTDPGVTLLLAGEPYVDEPGYWDECLAAIALDPAGFEVRAGFLPDDELPKVVATVDAFVVAYRDFNSASSVGIVAALSNRPVLGTASGNLGEMFDLGMTGVKIGHPVTPEKVAAAILEFRSRSIEEWRIRANQAAKDVGRSMSWEGIAAQYIELINKPN